jgi:RNA polymerase sigma-70 factor (ECF subfamily)
VHSTTHFPSAPVGSCTFAASQPWLPEPLLLDEQDLSSDAVLAAVFVLREVFGCDYAEIAEAVGRPAATVRQVAHRAGHIQARRRRFTPVDPNRNARITAEFVAAAAGCASGDVDAGSWCKPWSAPPHRRPAAAVRVSVGSAEYPLSPTAGQPCWPGPTLPLVPG